MQALAKILRGIVRLTIQLAIIYAVFLALTWALLGVYPIEAWTVTRARVSAVAHFVTGATSGIAETAVDMKKVGGKHLQNAHDRFEGKDPYEGYDKSLNKLMQ